MGGRDYDGQKSTVVAVLGGWLSLFCTPAGNRAVASALPTTLIKGLMNHSVPVFVPPGGIEPSSKV